MADYLNYAIKERLPDGSSAVLATIVSADPKRAFITSLLMVKRCYQKAGVEQPMFEIGPRFYAEPVGGPVGCEE